MFVWVCFFFKPLDITFDICIIKGSLLKLMFSLVEGMLATKKIFLSFLRSDRTRLKKFGFQEDLVFQPNLTLTQFLVRKAAAI